MLFNHYSSIVVLQSLFLFFSFSSIPHNTASTITCLECSMTGERYEANALWNLSPASARPLLARYDLAKAAETLNKSSLARRERRDLWRYEEVLPVQDRRNIVSLGEGGTPLVHAARLGKEIGCAATFIKDESPNPTGSFKARGQAVAVSRAKELGAQTLAIPSAGNAGGAMSAYAAAANLPARVFMPADVPIAFRAECNAFGAELTLVEGLINDCGAKVREGAEKHGWFDLSTLKEPYRLEGKKTMGYELAEQMDWALPDAIIYPAGGGTGLIGLWKAFEEMEILGLLPADARRPKMICVQSDGCAPIVKAYRDGVEHAPLWENAKTIADGLRVPAAVGDFLMIRAIKESGGTALSVSDDDMITHSQMIARATGIFPAPEGGACLAAQVRLLREGWLRPDESVVLFNTGAGVKYAHLWA
jgi:threonine synthase